MNRFIIEYELFKTNPKYYIENMLKISRNRIIKHVIINGCEISYLDYIRDNIVADNRVYLYNDIIDINNDNNVEVTNGNTYIHDITVDNISEYIATEYYKQHVLGYSALKPMLNSLVEVRKDGSLWIYKHDINIGDIFTGVNYTTDMYQNKFVGLKGKCSTCLNCLCDVNKKSNIFTNMVNENECILKDKIKDLVPKEVKEVTQEQFMYLIESMNEVNNGVDMMISCADMLMRSDKED